MANGGTSAVVQSGGTVAVAGAHTGGLLGTGGNVANAGASALGNAGGIPGTGGTRMGGAPGSGSTPATGGISATNTGGMPSVGGAKTGGSPGTGGAPTTGGSAATGGARTGGAPGTGGSAATGGKAATGGAPTTGGSAATGGARTGGAPGTGGSAATGGKAATGGAATGGSTASVNCSGPALTGGTPQCSSNASGTVGSYTWTIWSSGSGGCMTPYGVGAAYKATWNNSADFLAREGLQWNSTQTYTQIGTISADYAYTKTGSDGGYSYIGIYGWSQNPLHEYYIVDDWFGSDPPTGGGALMGTLNVDGGTYNIYTHTQTNQPSITGSNATFVQFFSVRQTARQCGHISISAHFAKWASLGMALGNMYEAKILVEVGGGTGSIDFTTATVTAN